MHHIEQVQVVRRVADQELGLVLAEGDRRDALLVRRDGERLHRQRVPVAGGRRHRKVHQRQEAAVVDADDRVRAADGDVIVRDGRQAHRRDRRRAEHENVVLAAGLVAPGYLAQVEQTDGAVLAAAHERLRLGGHGEHLVGGAAAVAIEVVEVGVVGVAAVAVRRHRRRRRFLVVFDRGGGGQFGVQHDAVAGARHDAAVARVRQELGREYVGAVGRVVLHQHLAIERVRDDDRLIIRAGQQVLTLVVPRYRIHASFMYLEPLV